MTGATSPPDRPDPPHHPPTRWARLSDAGTPQRYAERTAARIEAERARGGDGYGEARLVSTLAGAGGRVLDGGCGTGRVALRLAELGFEVTGLDLDTGMLAVARRSPGSERVHWVEADLGQAPGVLGGYDVVVLAGNVVPLLAEGTLRSTVAHLAGLLAPEGTLVAGFGLDASQLPPGCPVTPVSDWDAACGATGLVEVSRWSTWERDPVGPDDGYVVSVQR